MDAPPINVQYSFVVSVPQLDNLMPVLIEMGLRLSGIQDALLQLKEQLMVNFDEHNRTVDAMGQAIVNELAEITASMQAGDMEAQQKLDTSTERLKALTTAIENMVTLPPTQP